MLCFGHVVVSAVGDALLRVAAARGVAFPSPNVDTATSRRIAFLQCPRIHWFALVILGLGEQQADSASRMTHTRHLLLLLPSLLPLLLTYLLLLLLLPLPLLLR